MIPVKQLRFRDMFPIATNHATHGIYYYPARFIPHVVRYCLMEYARPGQTVLDPFAGSGTVGVEAMIRGLNSVLIDINPMLAHLVRAKTLRLDPNRNWEPEIKRCLSEIENFPGFFTPDWDRMDYWFDQKVLRRLSGMWAGAKALDSPIKPVIEMALLKVSREFSWDEDAAPKLFRSRRKTEKMRGLLGQNWQERLIRRFERVCFDYMKRVIQFNKSLEHKPLITVIPGVDSSEAGAVPRGPFDLVITSPPYLIAQEYMRTSKIDLFWLGYSHKQVQELSRREIPYKKAPENWRDLYPGIKRAVDPADGPGVSYFYHVFRALDQALASLKPGGHLCVFVGNPVRKGVEIPVWKCVLDWARGKGAEPVEVIQDPIVRRKLFTSRKNPNPSGMSSEFLVVMRKTSLLKD